MLILVICVYVDVDVMVRARDGRDRVRGEKRITFSCPCLRSRFSFVLPLTYAVFMVSRPKTGMERGRRRGRRSEKTYRISPNSSLTQKTETRYLFLDRLFIFFPSFFFTCRSFSFPFLSFPFLYCIMRGGSESTCGDPLGFGFGLRISGFGIRDSGFNTGGRWLSANLVTEPQNDRDKTYR